MLENHANEIGSIDMTTTQHCDNGYTKGNKDGGGDSAQSLIANATNTRLTAPPHTPRETHLFQATAMTVTTWSVSPTATATTNLFRTWF